MDDTERKIALVRIIAIASVLLLTAGVFYGYNYIMVQYTMGTTESSGLSYIPTPMPINWSLIVKYFAIGVLIIVAFIASLSFICRVIAYKRDRQRRREWDAEKKEKQLSELLSTPLLSPEEQEAEELKHKYLSDKFNPSQTAKTDMNDTLKNLYM